MCKSNSFVSSKGVSPTGQKWNSTICSLICEIEPLASYRLKSLKEPELTTLFLFAFSSKGGNGTLI